MAETVNEMSFNLVKSVFGSENVRILAKIDHKYAIKEIWNRKIVTNRLKYEENILNNDKVIKFIKQHPYYYLICWKFDKTRYSIYKLPKTLNFIKPTVVKYYGLNKNKKYYNLITKEKYVKYTNRNVILSKL